MNPNQFEIRSSSEAQTIAEAQNLASKLNASAVLCLHGTLGMGKSVFARALIRSLCGDENLDVPSPTFTLVQQYNANDGRAIYHFDLYRLQDPDEIYELGWEDALADGLCIIEWPERLGSLKPRECVDIYFTSGAESNSRTITITGLQP